MKGRPAGCTGGIEDRTRAASRCGPDSAGRSGRLATRAILRFGGQADQDMSQTVTASPAASEVISSGISSRQFDEASQRRWWEAGGP